MEGADLERRARVARLALEQDQDLELEYHDEATDQWLRLHATPDEIYEIRR